MPKFLPIVLSAMLAGAFSVPVAAQTSQGQGMRPNKEPVASPSDLRAESGEDRPNGEAREDRTPSPSDLAVQRPGVDGDLPMKGTETTRRAGRGTASASEPNSDSANPERGSQFR